MMIFLAHAVGFVRRCLTSSKQRAADLAYARRYFNGYLDRHAPHPCFAATGSEGRCELCEGEPDDPRHVTHAMTKHTVKSTDLQNH